MGRGMLMNGPVNRSGTVTLGGTAQQVMPVNRGRRGFWFQNVSDTDMWISELGDAVATQPAIKVEPGAMYETYDGACPTSAISVLCATTGKAFSAREWA